MSFIEGKEEEVMLFEGIRSDFFSHTYTQGDLEHFHLILQKGEELCQRNTS
jgi:hypothetical protein